MTAKTMAGIVVIKKLSKTLPQHLVITINRFSVRPHLDYDNVLYDKPNNKHLCQKIWIIQYNAAVIVTGSIKGISQMKFYNELSFEPLKGYLCYKTIFCYEVAFDV